MSQRGYFAIGIENGKTPQNIGSLWRSAMIFGSAFVFTIGQRYKHQVTDTTKATRHVPLFTYDDPCGIYFPENCKVIGVEMGGTCITEFEHPERAIYILGAEDHGLSQDTVDICDEIVSIPGDFSLNVAVAGSIVMFDRLQKRKLTKEPAQQ